ncbi:hypothetical protein Ddye_025850 [Dipteronia dyeriana]|uniref:Reverse transcriptase/retrotransposon-derived protein RNase H-like domain-containing protein n=1 Tax=Dipteronia dyeriana TaxID=168575 RepID=A0AAD9WPZ9_9ROSI|nr:hypothetical protein Ddye_025850 [Dipteronia dyeriana]
MVGPLEIDFPEMYISHGQYQSGPHLAKQLLDFPDSNLNQKQLQQVLGIINFIRDFIPHVSHSASVLSALLNKNPPPRSPHHTEVVATFKNMAQRPPPLTIPSIGQLILQTDDSDDYWEQSLFEEKEGKQSYCGHASGQFKNAQKHYHTIYKEILTVKYGIQKFDFHLRTRCFTV